MIFNIVDFYKLVFSPDGKMLAGLDLMGNLNVWAVNPFSKVYFIQGPSNIANGSQNLICLIF
jgi:hypothetical protein